MNELKRWYCDDDGVMICEDEMPEASKEGYYEAEEVQVQITFWKKIAKGWEQSRDEWFRKAKSWLTEIKRRRALFIPLEKENKRLVKQVEEAERSAKNWEEEAQRYAANSDYWHDERLAESKRAAERLKQTWLEFDKPLDPEYTLPEPFGTIRMIAADWYNRFEEAKAALKNIAMLSPTHKLLDGSSYGCGQCLEIIERAKKALAKLEEMKADCWVLPEGVTTKTDKTEAPTYFTDREREAFEESVVKEDTEKKIACDRCGKCVDVWDIVEMGSKEYCRECEKLYDTDRKAFEDPIPPIPFVMDEVNWSMLGLISEEEADLREGKGMHVKVTKDAIKALLWLKEYADSEKERLSKLEKIVDAMWLHHGGDMK